MNKLFAALSLILLGMVIFWVWKDENREWKTYQRTFHALEQEKAKASGKSNPSMNKLEIKQIVIPELDRVDRCISCHLGVEDSTNAFAPQPYTCHPNYMLHPFEKFGCTICHLGQGRATTEKAAHGEVKFWEEPLLPLKYIQSSCGKCHLDATLAGALELSQGIAKYEEYDCGECHKIKGEGGTDGPDLSEVGSHRNPDYLFKLLKDPEALNPETGMPNFELSDEEIDALIVYLLSLTKEKIPSEYLYSKSIVRE